MIEIENLRVLIVDDQSDVRKLVRSILVELGMTQIFDAASAEEAVAFMNRAHDMVDVVICDWNMPGKSGLEVLEDLQAKDIHIPFLMLTGRSDRGSVVKARDTGVNGYVRKPFTPAQLEARLRIIMQNAMAPDAEAASETAQESTPEGPEDDQVPEQQTA